MKKTRMLIRAVTIVMGLLPLISLGADLSISPVRVNLNAAQKTDIIKVKNLKDTPVSVQVSLFAWTQDDAIKDVTVPTDDIIAFPKIFTIAAGEERIIRIGKRVNALNVEKTYRLYIEEIPGKMADSTETGPVIHTLTRIGIPIFLMPPEERYNMSIAGARLSAGQLELAVRNDGNVHIVIHEIKVTGSNSQQKPIFHHEIAGWYLLTDHVKTYQIQVPSDQCLQLKQLDMEVVSDKSTRSERIDVTPEMCQP